MEEKIEMPFVFYPSFRNQLKAIKNEKVRLTVFEALVDYGVLGKEPNFNDIDPLGTVEALFVPIRQEIDKAKARYIANVENGKKGGAPKGNKNARNAIEHTPPKSVEEVRNFCNSEGLKIDCEAFFDYWSEKGWKWRNPKLKNWHDLAKKWENLKG